MAATPHHVPAPVRLPAFVTEETFRFSEPISYRTRQSA